MSALLNLAFLDIMGGVNQVKNLIHKPDWIAKQHRKSKAKKVMETFKQIDPKQLLKNKDARTCGRLITWHDTMENTVVLRLPNTVESVTDDLFNKGIVDQKKLDFVKKYGDKFVFSSKDADYLNAEIDPDLPEKEIDSISDELKNIIKSMPTVAITDEPHTLWSITSDAHFGTLGMDTLRDLSNKLLLECIFAMEKAGFRISTTISGPFVTLQPDTYPAANMWFSSRLCVWGYQHNRTILRFPPPNRQDEARVRRRLIEDEVVPSLVKRFASFKYIDKTGEKQ